MDQQFLADISVQIIGTFCAAFLGALSAILMGRWDTRRHEHLKGVHAIQRLIFDLNRRRALDVELQSAQRPGLNRREDKERARTSITDARNLAIDTASALPLSMETERNCVLHMVGLCNSYLEQQELNDNYAPLLVQLSIRLRERVGQIVEASPRDKLISLQPGAGAMTDFS